MFIDAAGMQGRSEGRIESPFPGAASEDIPTQWSVFIPAEASDR